MCTTSAMSSTEIERPAGQKIKKIEIGFSRDLRERRYVLGKSQKSFFETRPTETSSKRLRKKHYVPWVASAYTTLGLGVVYFVPKVSNFLGIISPNLSGNAIKVTARRGTATGLTPLLKFQI